MQIKELKAKTKESDNRTPTPPNDPVDLSRWVQVTHNDPKPPREQPDDPALTPTPIKKPIPNNVIGTDKPKRKKPKKANTARTRVPSYLRVPRGVPASQVKNIGLGRGLLKFMQWYSNNQSDIRLEKLDASQLTAFGLGWYISDNLTRDEKKQWQRQLDEQFQRSIDQQRQEERKRELRRMARSGRRLDKSAYGKLQDYYRGFMN